MAAIRFQIYLEPEQHQKIRDISNSKEITMAAVIREALDQYLKKADQPLLIEDDPIWSIVGATSGNTRTTPETT